MPLCQARQFFAALVVGVLSVASARAEPVRLAMETRTVMPGVDRFVAAEAFKVGAKIGERKIWLIGHEFETRLSSVIETDVRATPLQAWTLRYSTHDAALIKNLGGEDNAILPLSAVYFLIALGEQGGSRIDWGSNIAYVRAPGENHVRAVRWFVNNDGEWVIGAAHVPHPAIDWPPGSRLFGRASGATSDQIQVGTVLKR
jgi:hypothetical protein